MTQLGNRDNEIMSLNSEISGLKDRLKLADQANDEIRGKMLDYQLETESLQVCMQLVYISLTSILLKLSTVDNIPVLVAALQHSEF